MLLIKYGPHKYSIDLPKDSTVLLLKQEIENLTQVVVAEQKLIFSGKQLSDAEKTLESYGLSESSPSPQSILLVKQIDTSRSIILYVRTIQRELDFKLLICLSEKIERIRNMINEKVSLPSNYSLVYSGIVLQDQQTVLDYGIRERSSVYIVTQIVMEVENPTGERVKMRINDNRITGEVVERLVEQRRAVKSQRKRKHHSSSSSSHTETSTTTMTSSRPATTGQENEASFAGFRAGFLLGDKKASHPPHRKRSRTATMMESTTFEASSGSGDGVTTCTAITSTPAATLVDPLTSNCNGTAVTTATTRVPTRTVESKTIQDISPAASPIPLRKCEKKVNHEEQIIIPSPVLAPLRCFQCTKKIGLTGIQCKCSQHFCGAHRYPEEHVCSFDYRAKAKEDLTKANPKVAPTKIIQIGK